MNLETISPRDYLDHKGIPYREIGSELVTRCLFNDCDVDSKGNEAHLYFNSETGQYECKKCGERGNLITLAKRFGDEINEVAENRSKIQPNLQPQSRQINDELVGKLRSAIPQHIRQYLHQRGISDEIIERYQLGYGQFYQKNWITIPIKDTDGEFYFLKLRQDPDDGDEKMSYPKGIEAQVYDWENLENPLEKVIICEGELDRLILISKGIAAVTSTHGAGTFKKEWLASFDRCQEIYICFDNDDAGKRGAERVVQMFIEGGRDSVKLITLPDEVGEGGDITDYFVKLNGSVENLFGRYAKEYPEKIDVSKFSPLSPQELVEILGLTIKEDEENKLVTFLCQLSAYTEDAQFNISFNAPSSTGKSYIPIEIARLFPKEDVKELAYCSPTAFFHDVGEYNKEFGGYVVDLSRKIMIFLDQPHNDLLARLRPLLSHDEKEISLKITDKTQKYGLKTKNVLLKGYPAVIFCTTGLRIDEQEGTRFLLLSPETNQEKIREGVLTAIKKEIDAQAYRAWLDENPSRRLLKERIKAIRQEGIKEIKISSSEEIKAKFLSQNKILKPRHQRDIKRLLSLIKVFALLNLWWRERDGRTVTANEADVESAFAIWEKISVSQELNLPPYIFELYQKVILNLWKEKNVEDDNFAGLEVRVGMTRQEILERYYKVYGRMLDTCQLRQQILPMLEIAGLINQEPDPNDKRKVLIYPTAFTTISDGEREGSLLTEAL